MSKCVAITGATGFIGQRVCSLLHQRGWRVRALLRSPQRAQALQSCIDEPVPGGLDDLARGDPAELADPKRAPEAFVREWVSRTQEIHQARAVAKADGEESDPELDELISRFRLDPAALS